MSIKKSLIFSSLMLSSLLYGDNLSDALKSGKISGQAQMFFYDIDKKQDSSDAYATSLGGYLKYQTGNFYNLSATAKFWTSNSVFSEDKPEKTRLFDSNGDAIHSLSEAYIRYNAHNFDIKLGRQELNTPLINNDNTRLLKYAYEAYQITNSSIPNTKLTAMKVTKVKANNSSDFTTTSSIGKMEDGVYMFSIDNKSIPNLRARAYYYIAEDLYDALFAQFDYKNKLTKDFKLIAGLQYYKAEKNGDGKNLTSKVKDGDINLFALRLGGNYQNFQALLNYSKNSGEDGYTRGYGGLGWNYTTSMNANGKANFGPETKSLKLSYNLKNILPKPLKIAYHFTNTEYKSDITDNSAKNFDAHYFELKYTYQKKSYLKLRYQTFSYEDSSKDADYLRLIATYDF